MTASRLRSNGAQTGTGRGRQPRADGDATRADIVETAGRLFAERGYLGTTSKSICEQAGVNLAAINYHFGSRDGLYLAVLKKAHQRFMSLEFLRLLSESRMPPAEKLRHLLVTLVQRILDDESWAVHVWTREVLAPSPMLGQAMQEEAQPKFGVVAAIVGEVAGIAVDDPRMPRLVLSVIAPCIVMVITSRVAMPTPFKPLFAQPAEVLADGLWRFAMAGLRSASEPVAPGT